MSTQMPLYLHLQVNLITQLLTKGPGRGPPELKPVSMAPRATVIKEQGFFEQVAARTEAPQKHSTRTVYEVKWEL